MKRPSRQQHTHAPLLLVATLALGLALGLALTSCSALTASTLPSLAGSSGNIDSGSNSSTNEADAKTADNGYLSEPLSPFDEDQAAIAKLNPDLRAAVQAAATDADADGVDMVVNSGWRSSSYQRVLLDEAVEQYGSMAEARKWVNTPKRSSHVSGNAVDIGYTDADSWLSQHGADYGLCQIYANEMWHFELAIDAGGTCPDQLTDATAG